MKIRNLFIILIILLLTGNINAQNTFSKLYPLKPYRVTTLNSIVVTDDAYYATGIVVDSIFPFRDGALFMKFDLNGNVLIASKLVDKVNNYSVWFQSLVFDRDSNLYTSGYNHYSDTTLFFLKYNRSGEVLEILKNQKIPGSIEGQNQFVINKDEMIVFPSASPGLENQQRFFSCIDTNNIIKWETEIFDNISENVSIPRMAYDGKNYLTGWIGFSDFVGKNMVYRTIIMQFDSLGNKFWEYSTAPAEDWIGTLGGIEYSDDGDIVYVSGKGTIINPLEISDHFNWDWCFTKLGFDKQIKWRTYFRQPDKIDENARRLWNMLKLKNKQGYISVGTNYLDKSYGWLTKVSEGGDSLWSRTYNLEEDDNIFYEIRQVKEDNELNLILAGERINYLADTFSQQGWLMKLDKYGCLIPGCHISATHDLGVNEIDIKLYPNPANDFLAFQIDLLKFQKIDYVIISSDGKIKRRGYEVQNNVTNVVEVSDYLPGQYSLILMSENEVLGSKSFIIQH